MKNVSIELPENQAKALQDLPSWLTTLKKNVHDENVVNVKIDFGYQQLGWLVGSIVSVCSSVVRADENQRYCELSEVADLLDLVKDLMPSAELELLDKLKP